MKGRATAMVVLALSLAGCLLLDPWDGVTRDALVSAEQDGPTSDVPDSSTATDSSVIGITAESGAPLSWMYERAVWLGGCTGTRIAPRFVISALRCLGDTADGGAPPGATFYTKGPGPDPTQTAKIVALTSPPGTDGPKSDFSATNGDFADIVVAELDHDITLGAAAAINWSYGGEARGGYKVGVEDFSARSGVLRLVSDTTDSMNDADGIFRTRYVYDDLGSAFYVGGRAIGVLSPPDGPRARFTSLAHHLPWILDAIRYRWPAGPPIAGSVLVGTASQTFNGTERVCQYACDLVSSCIAYDYVPTTATCSLIASASTVQAVTGAHYAVRWALRGGSSRAGDPVGYVRADGSNAATHRIVAGGLGQLGSIAAAPGWAAAPLTSAPAGRPSVYVRSDRVEAAVYRDTSTAHIVEVAFTGGAWVETDLTAASGAPNAAGDPAAYVRADGVSAVVYRSTSNHIVELSLGAAWAFRDLNTLTSAVLAASDPSAFVRSDHFSSVVYRGVDNHVEEIFQDIHGAAGTGDPFAIATQTSGADFGATGTPYGYVRHDGVTAIVYRASDGKLRELANIANWVRTSLDVAGALPVAGNPVAYVRSDGTSAVVYRSTTNRIIEIARSGTSPSWVGTDLTNGAGAVPVADPSAYVHADGTNAVLFRSADNHVWELTLGGATWTPADLTDLAGETP